MKLLDQAELYEANVIDYIRCIKDAPTFSIDCIHCDIRCLSPRINDYNHNNAQAACNKIMIIDKNILPCKQLLALNNYVMKKRTIEIWSKL